MRRIILLFSAVLLVSIGWSQTMTITFDDGTTVKYDMNKVKSIDFTSDESGNNQDTTPSLIGTWKEIGYEGWITSYTYIMRYIHFENDGTYTDIAIYGEEPFVEILKGTWKLLNNNITTTNDKGVSLTSTIVEMESDKFVITAIGNTYVYQRVSDSEIEKYLNN